MPDVFSAEKRREIMSLVRGKDTRPEKLIRSELHKRGLRFRVNYSRLPGSPDICFPKHRTVIFVNGCFWHGHGGCPRSKLPETNHERWEKKIAGNIVRDKRVQDELTALGWRSIIVWTCEIGKGPAYFDTLVKDIVLADSV